MEKRGREKISIIVGSILIASIILWALISPDSYQVTDGIYTIDLLGLCSFDVYDTTVLPEFTIAYRCPNVDYIKIWPFPVESPWEEDIAEFWRHGSGS